MFALALAAQFAQRHVAGMRRAAKALVTGPAVAPALGAAHGAHRNLAPNKLRRVFGDREQGDREQREWHGKARTKLEGSWKDA